MFFIVQSFSALSRLRVFAMMSDAVYRSIGVRQAVIRHIDLSIPVRIHFKGSLTLTQSVSRVLSVLGIGYI